MACGGGAEGGDEGPVKTPSTRGQYHWVEETFNNPQALKTSAQGLTRNLYITLFWTECPRNLLCRVSIEAGSAKHARFEMHRIPTFAGMTSA